MHGMPIEERRMTMPECKLCGEGLHNGEKLSPITDGDLSEGQVHQSCRNDAIDKAISARGDEKPKDPTLEERVVVEIQFARTACIIVDEMARRIISMVREHDGASQKLDIRTHKQQVDQLSVVTKERDEWKDRAEKAEVVVVHYREQIAHRDGKIAVMKSQLEYLQDSIRVARDALNK
jgi:hypothetical protein